MLKSVVLDENSLRSCNYLVIILNTHGIQCFTYIIDWIKIVLD